MKARSTDTGRTLAERRQQPGGQFALREVRFGKWVFLASFTLAFIAILQSLVKAQDEQCFGLLPGLCMLKLFEPSDALTVFAALVALFYTRKQIVDAQLPYLVYEGSGERRATSALDAGDSFHVVLKNVGSGIAIIQAVRYHICVGGRVGENLDYDEVVAQLGAAGIKPERHFALRRFGQGYGLAKDGELVVFEILRAGWESVQWLDCDLDFRDVGGRLYRKHIFCVPRDKSTRFPAATTSKPV